MLLLAAGAPCLVTLHAYNSLHLKHAEVKHIFHSVIAASAAYFITCAFLPHGYLIPIPKIDFILTPIEEVESKIITSAVRSSVLTMALVVIGLTTYYMAGPFTERGIVKLDELIESKRTEMGEKDSHKPTMHRTIKKRFNMSFLGGFGLTLLAYVAVWPSNWILSFSYTICEYNSFVLATDHVYWAILTFSLAKTTSTLIQYLNHPTQLISNGVHVWTNFCWFYGTSLLAAAAVFWALALDVLMVYLYKATMLIQHHQSLNNMVVNGVPKQFNFLTGFMADFLLEGAFTRGDAEGSALNSLLHEQLRLYERVIDDSMWIILLWVIVLFPFCKCAVVYYTLRTKLSS